MSDPDPVHVEAGRRAAETRARRDQYVATKTAAFEHTYGTKPGKKQVAEWVAKSKEVVT